MDGTAGSDGASSDLTCGADRFIAMNNGACACAELRATLNGSFSGDGNGMDYTFIGELITTEGYSVVGLEIIQYCDDQICEFVVIGAADGT